MRQSKVTEEQIIAALKLAEAGGNVDEVCRKLGVTRNRMPSCSLRQPPRCWGSVW
jgi:hypothetical protein